MNQLNLLFTLTSLNVVLVTLERFSFTTKILLPPYNFLRLHEFVQMLFIILFTVVIPFFILRLVTNKFETLKTKTGLIWGLVFILGVYYYSTGNGVHEIASFFFNNYCDVKRFSGNLCSGFFFNDYYFGNILYFVGATLMNVSLIFLEKLYPNRDFKKKDLWLNLVNAFIYALPIFAYSGFDRVLVGLVYGAVVMLISGILLWQVKDKYLNYPLTLYTCVVYTLGTLAALAIRVVH